MVDRPVVSAVSDEDDGRGRAGERTGERGLAPPHAFAPQCRERLVVHALAARSVEELEDGATGEGEREVGCVVLVDAEAARPDAVDVQEQAGRLEHRDDVGRGLEQRGQALGREPGADLLFVERGERPLEQLAVAVGALVGGVHRPQQRGPALLVGWPRGVEGKPAELALEQEMARRIGRGPFAHHHWVLATSRIGISSPSLPVLSQGIGRRPLPIEALLTRCDGRGCAPPVFLVGARPACRTAATVGAALLAVSQSILNAGHQGGDTEPSMVAGSTGPRSMEAW